MPSRCRLALFALSLLAAPALAKDTALGTLTVRGKTTQLDQVWAEKQSDPEDESDQYLVILVADRPVAAGDRSPERLYQLAGAGKLNALRATLHLGYDDLRVAPYQARLNESGLATKGLAVLDLGALDEERVEAKLSSKPLGQEWHFNVQLKAAITIGGQVELERLIEGTLPVGWTPEGAQGKEVTPLTQLKYEIGKRGYAYDAEGLMQAVWDADVEAVELFLKAGMPPDTVGSNGIAPLMYTSMYCANEPADRRLALAKVLIAARANVNVKDENGSTPLIWAAQTCPRELVEALIAGGADVNAKAKGGATPLMMAEVMQRAEVAAVLKKAGAKPWQQ